LVKSTLTIRHARAWRCEDPEGVGYYDFNEVRYEPEAQRMTITTGVPLFMEALVEALDVAVEITDELVSPA
jgi:hypothetical protein